MSSCLFLKLWFFVFLENLAKNLDRARRMCVASTIRSAAARSSGASVPHRAGPPPCIAALRIHLTPMCLVLSVAYGARCRERRGCYRRPPPVIILFVVGARSVCSILYCAGDALARSLARAATRRDARTFATGTIRSDERCRTLVPTGGERGGTRVRKRSLCVHFSVSRGTRTRPWTRGCTMW